MSESPDDLVLAGLVSNHTSDYKVAQELLVNIARFASIEGWKKVQDPVTARVAEIAVKFYNQTGDFLDALSLEKILRDKALNEDEINQHTFTFSVAAGKVITAAKFSWWVEQLSEASDASEIATILQKTAAILEGRVTDKDSILYSGARDARTYLQTSMAQMAKGTNIHKQPSGDIRLEWQTVLEEVEKAERGETTTNRFKTGLNFIDDHTNGMSLGDFMLVGAHTGEGKTQVCLNVTYNFTIAGHNGLYVTAETAREKCRRRLYVRHTHAPGIGVIGGIPYDDVKTGKWEDEKHREIFARTTSDFGQNPRYGTIDVTQISAGGTIEDIRDKAEAYQQEHGVALDYVVVDYLALLSTKSPNRPRREELNEILIRFKELCLTFNNGTGLLGVAAHQTKQERREIVKPESGKFYTVRDYSDTSEAGKSIDVGVMLLRNEELEKVHELAAALVKNRDAECPSEVFKLYEGYKTSYLGNIDKAA